MQCALFGNAGSTRGATMYSTLAPCVECSKMAISVGITRIVVMTDYSEDGTKLLSEARIVLTKLDLELLKPWVSLIIKDPKAYSSIAKS
jgi:dCMP deaminase